MGPYNSLWLLDVIDSVTTHKDCSGSDFRYADACAKSCRWTVEELGSAEMQHSRGFEVLSSLAGVSSIYWREDMEDYGSGWREDLCGVLSDMERCVGPRSGDDIGTAAGALRDAYDSYVSVCAIAESFRQLTDADGDRIDDLGDSLLCAVREGVGALGGIGIEGSVAAGEIVIRSGGSSWLLYDGYRYDVSKGRFAVSELSGMCDIAEWAEDEGILRAMGRIHRRLQHPVVGLKDMAAGVEEAIEEVTIGRPLRAR